MSVLPFVRLSSAPDFLKNRKGVETSNLMET